MSPASTMGQGHGTLSAAATMVADARHDLDRLDRELMQHVEAAQASWAGQGGAAFTAVGVAWSERQRTIVGSLDELAASLRATERDNVATDESQSAAFARCQQRLG